MKNIVTLVFFVSTLLSFAIANSDPLTSSTSRPRQRSDTRSWINVLQSGFIEGFARYSNHGKLDCTQEGMKITRAAADVFINRVMVDETGD